MSPKEYYSRYQADDNLSELSKSLINAVVSHSPSSVLDFGCGTGKHIAKLENVVTCGLDISLINLEIAHIKNGCNFLVLGTEEYLNHFQAFDVVITCSVLDHIERIDEIIRNFKRIAKKAIYLAETSDIVNEYYYNHDFTKYGFRKVEGTEWKGEDGATYYLYEWISGVSHTGIPSFSHDDLGKFHI